jgi:inner membrane protein
MMWHTHAAIGASATWLLAPFVPPDDSAIIAALMICCVAGAMVPDLDAVESKIKHVKVVNIKPLVSVSIAINRQFGHRGLLHSLRGWLIWTLMILPLGVVIGWLSVAALALGYASHLAGDACTPTGIPLLYPQRKSYHFLPREIRVVTGSEFEELFFVTFVLLSFVLLLARLGS